VTGLGVAIALLLPAAAGALVALWLFRGTAPLTAEGLLGAVAGALLGIGFASVGGYVAWSLHAPRGAYATGDAIAWCAVAVAAGEGLRRRGAHRSLLLLSRPDRGSAVALAALAAALAATVVFAVAFADRHPWGLGDAIAIWNLRAAELWRTWKGDHGLAFAIPASHPDYPVLLPASVARLWAYAGREAPDAGFAIALAFVLGGTLALAAAAWAVRGPAAGAVAGCGLLGTAGWHLVGAWQIADVPLAAFLLLALALLLVAEDDRVDVRGATLLAGAALGCAAWTKNEGLLLALVVVATRLAADLVSKGRRETLRRIVRLAVGAAVPLFALAAFRERVPASANDLVAGSLGGAALARMVEPGRLAAVLHGMLDGFLALGWGAAVLLVLLLVLRPSPSRLARSAGFQALLLALLGYVAVFLATPKPLAWHLETAANRLLLHLWPSTVLLLVAYSLDLGWKRLPAGRG
jgi:hypothetical protein